MARENAIREGVVEGLKFKHNSVRYRKGYKYQLDQPYWDFLIIKPQAHIKTDYITLATNGLLYIKKGYAWDGPSGLTFDTKSSIRGSLVHDALYQLMRMELLPQSEREAADYCLHERCIEDTMWEIRADLWLKAVRIGAGPAADPDNLKKVWVAP